MNVSKILSAIALAVIAASGGAHAETYDGVHVMDSVKSRGEVNALAVATAHAPNQNVTNGSRVLPAMTASADRAIIRGEAVAAAHAPNQNLDPKAFVNSVVPSQYKFARAGRQAAV
jgi:hypothetical protein